MSKAMIERAMRRILYGFEISADEYEDINIKTLLEMTEVARVGPVEGPCALIIRVNSRRHAENTVGILSAIIRAMTKSGLVRGNKIAQIHFERAASHKETIDIFLVAQDD